MGTAEIRGGTHLGTMMIMTGIARMIIGTMDEITTDMIDIEYVVAKSCHEEIILAARKFCHTLVQTQLFYINPSLSQILIYPFRNPPKIQGSFPLTQLFYINPSLSQILIYPFRNPPKIQGSFLCKGRQSWQTEE